MDVLLLLLVQASIATLVGSTVWNAQDDPKGLPSNAKKGGENEGEVFERTRYNGFPSSFKRSGETDEKIFEKARYNRFLSSLKRKGESEEEIFEKARYNRFLSSLKGSGESDKEIFEKARYNKTLAEHLIYLKQENPNEGDKSKRVIMWGTNWCGHGHRNPDDPDEGLGYFTLLDQCCKTHDNCPRKIEKGETKWGIKNTASNTIMDCNCDNEFYSCLKKNDDWTSWAVGKLFFNRLKIQCVDIPERSDEKPEYAGPLEDAPVADMKPAEDGRVAKLKDARHFKRGAIHKPKMRLWRSSA